MSNTPHFLLAGLLCVPVFLSNALGDDRSFADSILEATGVQGGFIAHLGCGDGRLTAALRANDSYLVHGLDRRAAQVNAARDHIHGIGLYGVVSVELATSDKLPYADNMVNLIVDEDGGFVSADEIRRVLRPGGVSYVKSADGWKKAVKPVPDEIDEWTHFLHSPTNNAVAKDSVVGPPNHLQWVGGPKWARGHEVLATISAIVTAGGRIFYIADEGAIASVDLPSKWVLVARDAFNGVLLWKLEIPKWESRFRPFRSGPTDLPRRLVAIGDRVYVTLGYGEPLTMLDAGNGNTLHTYEGTEGTEEILYEDGTLFLTIGDPQDQQKVDAAVRRGQPIPRIDKTIAAIDADSGLCRWKKSDDDTADLYSQTLAVADGRVVFQNTRQVICLDASSGEEKWRASRLSAIKRPAWSVPTLVIHDDVILSADRKAPEKLEDDSKPQTVDWTVSFAGGNAPPGEVIAFAADSGQRLWSGKCQEGYNSPVDLLLSDGLLWTGNLVKARDPGITKALDPQSGKVKRERPNDQKYFLPGMSHHRCYRNRATENYLLLGRSGVELVDVKTGKAVANHWVRGTCQYGILPANGLIYVPSHTCACYIKTKLNGFNALAAAQQHSYDIDKFQPRLERGPAIDTPAIGPATANDDWPTYRHDPARSGVTKTEVSAELVTSWKTNIGGSLSSVVVADGKLFVAEIDANAVHALDTNSGQIAWSFTAGGRVDSPPTLHLGRVIFGSADGWLYCLRADDGELAWRLRCGPEDRRIVIDGKLESAWPLHGNVLLQNDLVYFAAGRSSFLDGGIFLYAVDPLSGKVVSKNRFSGRDPETGEQPYSAVKGFDMPSGLPDVLTGDGTNIFMRDLQFGQQCELQPNSSTHLFSPTGFLDDSWWHRSYWLWGNEFKGGWGGWHQVGNVVPSGRLMVHDDSKIYGYGRNMIPRGNAGQWKSGEYYHLFSALKEPKKPVAATPKPQPKKSTRKKPPAKSTVNYEWAYEPDIEARAMVLAGAKLFLAGPKGVTQKSQAAFEGREGIQLLVVSASEGRLLETYDLDAMPVFDGMAAARGQIYLSTKDGTVRCFAKPK